jgi:two-component system, NarL family, response regulator YdfI
VIRVLIVAAAARARRALESLLHAQGFEVVGSFTGLEDAADVFAEKDPDAILVDASDASLEDLLGFLQETGMARETPVILLLPGSPPDAVSHALRLGVRGILPPSPEPQQLAAALEAVVRELVVLNSEAGSPIRPAAGRTAPTDELTEPLTPREREVLRLLASGLGNKEIAAKLKISEHTAKFHVASILGKLGAASRAEAVSIGMRNGLILL